MLIQKHHNQLTVTKNLDIACGAAVVLILKRAKGDILDFLKVILRVF